MKIRQKLLDFWKSLDSLENRIYYAILLAGTVASIVSTLFTIPQALHPLAFWSSLLCAVATLILFFISAHFHKERVCRVVLVYLVNLVLFPLNYFFCGGLTSGMVLFYLIGLFVAAIMLRGLSRILGLVISMVAMQVSITLSKYFPWMVLAPMTELQQFEDVKVTLFLTGTTLVVMTILILRALESERRHSQQLMEYQRRLSVRDPLTGLYNRRELFGRLEMIFDDTEASRAVRENTFLAMFDIDNFKSINDTFGHVFGDEVLVTVARIMRNGCRVDEGEMAARYGGEEFVLLLEAASAQEALERVEGIRQKIARQDWKEAPGLKVTISGGLVCCRDFDQLNRSIAQADALLYQAKRTGKNRTCTEVTPA